MSLVGIIGALLKLAGVVAEYMQQRGLMDAGAKAVVANAVIDLNRRVALGLTIQREHRTAAEDLDELRRGGM